MGDMNKRYTSFWRRHMQRSISSPSLSRKSGKLSKDEISMPYPGDPSGFGPLNSFHGSSQSKSTHFRSAEILSKSQSNIKESKLEKTHLGGSHGKFHLLKSQEMHSLDHHNAQQSKQSLGSVSSETPPDIDIVPTGGSDAPSIEIGETDSKAYNNSPAESGVESTSCNGIFKPHVNNEIDTLVNSTQGPLRSVNRQESKRLGALSLGKQSPKQTKMKVNTFNPTKDDEQKKKKDKKVKHIKHTIFGISFRRKKKEKNPIDKPKGNKKLYEGSEKVLQENESSEASSSCINSCKSQENILLRDKEDDLFNYGSPIYEIMTPTEIYERRASIKNLNGLSTPKLPNNQRRILEKEERYFDFDVSQINMKNPPESQNSKQSHKTYDAESRTIETSKESGLLEKNPTFNGNAGDNVNNIKGNSDSPEVNRLPEMSPPNVQDLNKSAMISSASEIKKYPDSVIKHQNVSRSRSEPTKAREDLRIHKALTHTQSEAFSPILDDHLQKHNKKVAAELGIDIPSLRKSDTPAIGGVGNTNDMIGGAAQYSISTKVVKRRPASFTLPDNFKTSQQTSSHSTPHQKNFDHNTKSVSRSLSSDSGTHKTKLPTSSDDFLLPGIQTPLSTKKQVVVQNSGYQKTEITDDTRHSDRHLLQTAGRATDSTDGPKAKHHLNTQETNKKINNSIQAAPPPVIVGAIKKKQQEHTKWSDHNVIHKDPLYPQEEHIPNNEDVHNIPSQQYRPLSREAALDPHFDDVFHTPTHRTEPSISQRKKGLVREDLYDIPRCHGTQPVTNQRSDHTQGLNVYDIPHKYKTPISLRQPTQPSASERDVAKAAVINWVTDRIAQLPANAQAMYVNRQWFCRVQPKILYRQPPIYEENREDIYQAYHPREFKTVKPNNYIDPYDQMSFYRSASLERLGPPPLVNSVVFGSVHSPIPHYNAPKKLYYPHPTLYYPSTPRPNSSYDKPTPFQRYNVTDQYAPFHRSASLDRLGRRPQPQSAVNMYYRSNDIPHRQFHSPQRYRSQLTNPTGFYRTASLDRLGRRTFVPPPVPGVNHLQMPHHLNSYQSYYHQPPMYMSNHQSASLDRRPKKATGGRSRAYSAAQATKPSASPQYNPSGQMHDSHRNYQPHTTI